MNPTNEAKVPARRAWWRRRWRLVAAVLFAGPPLLLAAAAWSYFALPGEATTLRDAMMRSTTAEWRTTVQADVGAATLAAVRAVVGGVEAPGVEDARLALRSVRRASVGVYRRHGGADGERRDGAVSAADAAMRRRGWERVVAVTEGARGDTVLIYSPAGRTGLETVEFCVAVRNARELVVVAGSVAPEALGELIARHVPSDWRERRDPATSQ